MNHTEIMEKITNLSKKDHEYEIFINDRPPEEFGDAVKLLFNQNDHTYTAIVFDPDTKSVFSEETLSDKESICSFISTVLDPKPDHNREKMDYIDLDIGEPEL